MLAQLPTGGEDDGLSGFLEFDDAIKERIKQIS